MCHFITFRDYSKYISEGVDMKVVVIWLIGILLYWGLIYGATKKDKE